MPIQLSAQSSWSNLLNAEDEAVLEVRESKYDFIDPDKGVVSPSACLIETDIFGRNLSRDDQGIDTTTCYTNDEVEICFQVIGYGDGGNCQWLQGIVPDFGDCFDNSSFTPSGEPVLVTTPLQAMQTAGEWRWYPAGEITYKLDNGPIPQGEPIGGGWFFTSFAVGQDNCNTHPSCSFGDGNQCDGAPGVVWEICFKLASGCPQPGQEDCEISFKTYSDGEIGGFPEEGCQLDEETVLRFRGECCEPPEILTQTYWSVCSGDNLNIPLSSTMDPQTIFRWEALPNPYGATSGTGSVITDNLYNNRSYPVLVTYLVTGICDLGCLSDVLEIQVVIYPTPYVFVEGEQVICAGECFEFTLSIDDPTGSTDIYWSDGSQGLDFTDCPPPGTYTYDVTVINQFGCADYFPVLAKVIPEPDVVILSSEATACSDPTLTAVLSDQTVLYQYLWSTGATTRSIDYQTGGTYSVTVTEPELGCNGFASIQVTTPLPPEELEIDGPDLACNNDFICFTGSVSGGTWSDPVDNAGCLDAAGLPPGIYPITYSYTDEDGCHFTATHELQVLPLPRINIVAPSTEICAGEVVEFSAEVNPTGAELTWLIGDATVVSGGVHEAVIGLSWPNGGTHTLGLSALDAVCSNYAELTVEVLPLYPAPDSDCEAKPSSVTFSWEAGPEGTVYTILGVPQTNNSYTVSDLAPETLVDVAVMVEAPGFCSSSTFSLSCSSEPCPNVNLVMPADQDICVGDGALVQSLLVEVQGDDGSGTGIWSGPGIVDGDAGAFDASLLGVNPGIRVLNYTYTNGQCVYRGSMNVILNPMPEVDAGHAVELSYDEGSARLTGSGSIGAMASWSGPGLVNGERTFSPFIDQAGTYVLTSTYPSTGCSAEDVVTVGFNYGPTLGSIASSNSAFTCDRAQITLSNTEIMRPNWSVSWSGPGITAANANQPEPNVDAPGWYYLQVHNPDNDTYSAVDSVFLSQTTTPPIIDLTRSGHIDCALQEVHFQNPGLQPNVTYRWTDPAGNEQDSPAYIAYAPGTYYLTAINTLTGCTNSEEIFVEDLRRTPTVELPASVALDCDGNAEISATITDPEPLTLAWTGPGGRLTTTPLLNATTPGTYQLTATNPTNSCSVSLDIMISGPDIPLSKPALSVEDESCYLATNGLAEVMTVDGGTPPYLYALDGGSFSSETSFSSLPPANYVLSVQDADGCLQDQSFTVASATQIDFELGTDKRVRIGKMVELSPAMVDNTMDRIVWTSELDINCLDDDCATVELMPLTSGWVHAQLMTPAGCEVFDSLYIDTYSENLLYLPTAFSPNNDGTNDVFFPQGNSALATVKAMRVFDRWGNLVFGREATGINDESSGWDGQRDGKALSPAVYIYQVDVAYLSGGEETIIGEVVLLR